MRLPESNSFATGFCREFCALDDDQRMLLFWLRRIRVPVPSILKTPEESLNLINDCYDKLLASDYDTVYASKFMVLRDKKILEYYINRKEN